ncbi:hypothetical protein [Thiobacter aerophilum]|uniref:Uncharacterized protein n=1 Tax=Thiobacter aerophilum TaxID=3121275 RepID=A0ABV0EEB3_9BURK
MACSFRTLARLLGVAVSGLGLSLAALAQDMSQQELEDWFNDDTSARIAAVNTGELVFLATPPAKPVHHHHNILTVDDRTLASGWAELRQCHGNLDRVFATQIVFRPERVRNLVILSREGIGQAWVEGATVQLRDIGPNARICLRLQSQVLMPNADGTYHVNSGPFMRRFLDGYYPMHVTMEVRLRTRHLRFLDITPASQQGFQVRVTAHQVRFDTWFEGRLQTLIRFTRVGTPPG